MAASIARRERKRLQYHKKKLDPTFAMRRSEYRRKYREKVKIRAQLIAKRAAAKVSDRYAFVKSYSQLICSLFI